MKLYISFPMQTSSFSNPCFAFAVGLLVLGSLLGRANAEVLFQDHFTNYGGLVNTAPPGWTKTPEAGASLGPDSSLSSYILVNFPANAPGSDGDSYFVHGHQLGATLEGFQKSISGFVIGTEYSLSFDYAAPQAWGFTSAAYWDVIIDGVVVDSSAPISLQAGNPLSWSAHQYNFIATTSEHVIGFNPRGLTGDTSAYFDNVVISAVPEPSSAFLLGAASAAFALLTVLRRKKADGQGRAGDT